MTRPKTVDETLAYLRSQPGINITKQRPSTKIIVETTLAIFELYVTDPVNRLVRVSGTDPRFKVPAIGQFLRSTYDLEGKVSIDNWIGKSMRMQIKFANGILACSCAVSARIEGDGWHFNVF